jgi:hypothetical protein
VTVEEAVGGYQKRVRQVSKHAEVGFFAGLRGGVSEIIEFVTNCVPPRLLSLSSEQPYL